MELGIQFVTFSSDSLTKPYNTNEQELHHPDILRW